MPKPTLHGNAGLDVDIVARCARVLLDRTGHPGSYPVEIVRELWRRGGEDQKLAERINAAGGAYK
ncbi:hypothetical protein SCD75_09630 [Prescottella equi]|nr:hypothetical protein SCD75_09630 [Prescottella equi]